MKHEDKDLLLKDLCARLPYGIKVNEDIQGDFTLIGLTKEKGYTLIPTKVYLKRGRAKLEFAIAKGKKNYDKREVEKKNSMLKEAKNAMKQSMR